MAPGPTWPPITLTLIGWQDAPEFIIDFRDIRIVKQIGHGSTCAVYVGWWEQSKGNPQPVAVKRFFLEASFKPEANQG